MTPDLIAIIEQYTSLEYVTRSDGWVIVRTDRVPEFVQAVRAAGYGCHARGFCAQIRLED